MSGFIAIASSKEIILPSEIQEYNDNRFFDIPNKAFSLSQLDEWEKEGVKQAFTMPYIYDVGGVGDEYFWVYIEKYMEIGDVLEIISVPNQRYVYEHVQKILENPEPIIINVGSLTYENYLGCFQLNKKGWIDDLKHRILYTDRGITTIVKY
ncbi:MAG: hypothetical protein WAM95_19190 [Bacillus sp. (in: firmicutes)]